MSWSPTDQARFRDARILRRDLRISGFQTWIFVFVAIVASIAAWFFAGRADGWRTVADERAVAVASMGHELEIARADLRKAEADSEAGKRRADRVHAEIDEQALANLEDLRRLAGIDEQLDAAGFETVADALDALRTCSAQRGDLRGWLGYCDGGFWRPEVGR